MKTEIIILSVDIALTTGIILFSRFLDKCWEESDRDVKHLLRNLDQATAAFRHLVKK